MGDRIPVIDLSNPNRKQIAEELVEAMETVGFAYLDKLVSFDTAFEQSVLEAMKWFFNLPLEIKMKCSPIKKWNPDAATTWKGYYPLLQTPPATNHRENLKFRHMAPENPLIKSGIVFYERTPWPFDEGGDAQRHYDILATFDEIMEKAGVEAARLLAPAIGFTEQDFVGKFQPNSCSDFNLFHYTKPDETTPNVLLPAHIDKGYFTLLSHLGYKGLQLYLDDTWIDFEPRPGLIGLNIGESMVKLSDGRFKGTRHRVVNEGMERYSAPYFFNPSYDSTFDVMQDGKLVTMKFGPAYQNSLRTLPPFSHIPPA